MVLPSLRAFMVRTLTMLFTNRSDAARQLIPLLERYANDDVVVMAVPRGAVPMARIIADRFHWPLSIVLVKKIGHPMNPEYAIGAAGLDAAFVEKGHSDVSEEERDLAIAAAQSTLRERSTRFLGNRPQPNLHGRTVIIVDDGIATGSTVSAAINVIRLQQPHRVVVAAPVAATSSVELLQSIADDVIVLHSSSSFMAVGEFYEDFPQVSDAEVIEALNPDVPNR